MAATPPFFHWHERYACAVGTTSCPLAVIAIRPLKGNILCRNRWRAKETILSEERSKACFLIFFGTLSLSLCRCRIGPNPTAFATLPAYVTYPVVERPPPTSLSISHKKRNMIHIHIVTDMPN